MTTGDKIKKSVIYILLVLLAAACLFPFLLMMVNATRDGVEITHSFTLIPSTHLKENWETVFSFFNLFRGMANSLLVAVPATLLTAYFSAMTAYGLAMYRFRGNKLIFTAILVFMMIPGQLSLIGFYNLCTKLKLVNSYIPLIVPAVAAPGTVFFLRQYILSVMPPALVEAARIDGASELYSFHRIALPIMSPGIATMAIMAFIGNWNNYLLPMIILNKNEKFYIAGHDGDVKSIDGHSEKSGRYLSGGGNLCHTDSDCVLLLLKIHYQQYFGGQRQRINCQQVSKLYFHSSPL